MEEDQQATVINVSSGKLAKHLLLNGRRNSFPITFSNATVIGEILATAQMRRSSFEWALSSAIWTSAFCRKAFLEVQRIPGMTRICGRNLERNVAEYLSQGHIYRVVHSVSGF